MPRLLKRLRETVKVHRAQTRVVKRNKIWRGFEVYHRSSPKDPDRANPMHWERREAEEHVSGISQIAYPIWPVVKNNMKFRQRADDELRVARKLARSHGYRLVKRRKK